MRGDVGQHDQAPAHHRLQHGHGQPLDRGGRDEQVGAVQGLVDLLARDQTGEEDPSVTREPARVQLEAREQLTVAHHDELVLRSRRPSEGGHHRGRVLDADQPADGHDQPGPPGGRRRDHLALQDPVDPLDVHPVGDHLEPSHQPPQRPRQGGRRGLATRDEHREQAGHDVQEQAVAQPDVRPRGVQGEHEVAA